MLKRVKSKAEEQFAAIQKKDKQALLDKEVAQQKRDDKIRRLKALRLAPDHDDHRAGLWDLVATARDRQGDKSGARQARSKAAALRNPKARPV